MQSNVVVSERLIRGIVIRYVELMQNGKVKEADDLMERLDPSPAFLALLKEQMRKEYNLD